ncbi:MAG: GNAT family N-acetyltransferase [Dinoroseobacter sp.]|nr:GNAT family N-acetyltransferase [Dinoroseobacter sp.]
MQIRRATPSDFGELTALWERAVWNNHQFLGQVRLEAERARVRSTYLPACRIWVAHADHTLGFIALRASGEIAGLFVDPQFQARGIGRALLDHVRDQAPLRVEVTAPNCGARRFYQQYGFREVARRRDPDLDEEMVMMRFDAGQKDHAYG